MADIELSPILRIHGKISAPCSKSYAQRAIAIAACSNHPVELTNYGESNDTEAALKVIESFGAIVERHSSYLRITKGINRLNKQPITLNINESGLSARMFSAFSLLMDSDVLITGHGSILSRPMDMVIEALESLGKKVESANGCLPLMISGAIDPIKLKIDGSESSQFLTGLLIVLPQLSQTIPLEVIQLKSTPYIDMTLQILKDFNVEISHQNYRLFEFDCMQKPQRSAYSLEGDWSGAAFLAVAGALGGVVELKNLHPNSAQADHAILDALSRCGADVTIQNKVVRVQKKELNAFQFDATHCPDLFPPLVALAAKCHGTTTIKGLHRLTHKESDRGVVLQEELAKAGVAIELDSDNDCMHISGSARPIRHNICFDSQNDHRIAMAIALFSIGAESKITIKNAQAIDKSYPLFFEDLRKLACSSSTSN
jgi:3-phosphoshikimate 1-carboxyvinyltransferase